MLSVLLLLAQPADAGTVSVSRKGITPAVLHVDGEKRGKLKKTEPLKLELKPGRHELAVTLDPDGTFVRCLGTVEVGDETVKVTVRDGGCDGLTAGGKPVESTLGRGAWIHVKGPAVDGHEISVDGGRAWFAPEQGLMLNVEPGKHLLDLPEHCSGEVKVDAGETAEVIVRDDTCEGLKPPGEGKKK